MKKIIYLISITILLIQGCSSDNNNSDEQSNDNLLFMERHNGYSWKCKTEDKYLWINNTTNPKVYANAAIGLYYYTPAANVQCYNEEVVWSTRTNDFIITSVNSQQSLLLKYEKYTTTGTFSWKIDGLAKTRTFTVQNNILKEEIEYFVNNTSAKKEVIYYDSLGKGFINSKISNFRVCR